METECSLQHPQQPTACPHSEPDQSIPRPPSHVLVSLQTKTQYFYCTFVKNATELFIVLTSIALDSRCYKNRGADQFKLNNNTNTSNNTRIQNVTISIFVIFIYFYNVLFLLLHNYHSVQLQYFFPQKLVYSILTAIICLR